MKKFRYLADPLFLIACGCYCLNRFWWKSHSHNFFFRSYFNDCLLIPCALPPILFAHRLLKLRTSDVMPTFGEVAIHFLIWSMVCEGIGPHFVSHTTADLWDVVAYGAGAILSSIWWHRAKLRQALASTSDEL